MKFDIKQLGLDLKLTRASRKTQLRKAAREMELPHATIFRLENNKQLDIHVATLVKVCKWVNTDPDVYFHNKVVRKSAKSKTLQKL